MKLDINKFKDLMRENNPDAYDRLYRSLPMRIQFALSGTLIAECIVPMYMMDRTIARYSIAKYRKGLTMGGVNIARADMPRLWDVPVGSPIKQKETN